MKADSSFCSLLVVAIYCLLSTARASDDQDLMDFDFADLKEVDWNYNDGGDSTVANKAATSAASMDKIEKKLQSNKVIFEDDFDENANQVHPFNWRERVLRTALSKALTNKQLRQRFIEVMPILRVLSSQQRIALSALISAQVNARQGQQLKLEQVRMMFGNDRKLLLPIVYDIANLVRNSARNYLHYDGDDLVPAAEYKKLQQPAAKRTIELTSAEEADDADDIGVIPISANVSEDDSLSLEDFFAEMPSDVLDPQRINEELQAPIAKVNQRKSVTKIQATTTKATPSTSTTTTDIPIARRRRRRSTAVETTEFVHKLLRSMPLSVNEDDLLRGAAGRTMRLNTTAFVLPQESQQKKQAAPRSTSSTTTTQAQSTAAVTIVTPSTNSLPELDNNNSELHEAYHEIEDLAFASLNGSEINLSSSATNSAPEIETAASGEPLPSPEELIAGPRYRIQGNHVRLIHPKMAMKRKRVQVRPRPSSPIPLPSKHAPIVVAPKKCERFTASMCIHADDYPL